MRFDELGLAPEILRAVAEQGYTEPTPIQQKAIPLVMAGKDIMGGAQTGTGKTAPSRCRRCSACCRTPARARRRQASGACADPGADARTGDPGT